MLDAASCGLKYSANFDSVAQNPDPPRHHRSVREQIQDLPMRAFTS